MQPHSLLACLALTPGTPRPQVSSRACVILSQSPPGDSAQRQLLNLVATSADLVGEFARAQLPDTEGGARAEAEAEAEAEAAEQKLESRRLQRSWDARLSWRQRKQVAAEEAAAVAEEQAEEQARSEEQARRRSRLGLAPIEQGPLDRLNVNEPHWSTAAASQAQPVKEAVPTTDGEARASWAPTLATAAAVTAAAVMQAAEMAAVALNKQQRPSTPTPSPTTTGQGGERRPARRDVAGDVAVTVIATAAVIVEMTAAAPHAHGRRPCGKRAGHLQLEAPSCSPTGRAAAAARVQ